MTDELMPEPNKTNPYDDKTKERIANTYPGQASWGGEADGQCFQCEFYAFKGRFAKSSMQSGKLKDAHCLKHKQLTNRKGSVFPPDAKACRFFSEDPKHEELRIRL